MTAVMTNVLCFFRKLQLIQLLFALCRMHFHFWNFFLLVLVYSHLSFLSLSLYRSHKEHTTCLTKWLLIVFVVYLRWVFSASAGCHNALKTSSCFYLARMLWTRCSAATLYICAFGAAKQRRDVKMCLCVYFSISYFSSVYGNRVHE